MKNQKGSTLIIVIIVLILVSLVAVGVVFFLTFNQDFNVAKEETVTSSVKVDQNVTGAEYKSYEAKDGSFSLRYPENLFLEDSVSILISEKINGKVLDDKNIGIFSGSDFISGVTRDLEKVANNSQSLTVSGFPAKKFKYKLILI